METSESIAQSRRPIPLTLVLLAVLMVHLPLLLMKLPLKSYDTNQHIFFASHYVHHWFDPWNVKVVRGLFADDISSVASAMGRFDLACCRT